jgi:hypothetical protein
MTLENSPSALAGAAIDYDLPCPKCRYNLKGLSAARCPECGYTLLPGELIASDIPWAHRRSRGRVRTYLHTVWRATFNMPRFFEELDRHVSYADAQHFRWTTILVAYAPWLLATIATVAAGQGQSLNILEFNASWQAVAAGAVPHLCLLLFLAGATGVPSYFFHPRHLPVEKQNRAIALSYYASGVLAWCLPACGLFVGMMFLLGAFDEDLLVYLGVTYAILCPLIIALWWAAQLHKLARHALGKGRSRLLGWTLLPLWMGLGAATLFVLPIMLLSVLVIILSML